MKSFIGITIVVLLAGVLLYYVVKELIKTFNYYLNTYQMITFDLKAVKL